MSSSQGRRGVRRGRVAGVAGTLVAAGMLASCTGAGFCAAPSGVGCYLPSTSSGSP